MKKMINVVATVAALFAFATASVASAQPGYYESHANNGGSFGGM